MVKELIAFDKKTKGRKCCSVVATIYDLKKLVAPQGVEPRYLEPKSSVLPLDEGAITMPKAKYKFLAHYWQHTFYFLLLTFHLRPCVAQGDCSVQYEFFI